jgi:hypothetical protein
MERVERGAMVRGGAKAWVVEINVERRARAVNFMVVAFICSNWCSM